MHPDVVRKMRSIGAALSLAVAVGVPVFVHGYVTKGWWLYLGLALFVTPLPFLMALARIWMYSRKYE